MTKNYFNVSSIGLCLALVCLLLGCEKEEKENLNRMRVRLNIGFPGQYGSADFRFSEEPGKGKIAEKPVAGAEAYLYITEEDFLLDRNAVAHGIADDIGQVVLDSDYWGLFYIRVRMEEFNNTRHLRKNASSRFNNYTVEVTELENVRNCCGEYVEITLSTTPTRLQLTVFNKGGLVEGAEVQLYLSQEAYENDLPAQEDYPELARSYFVIDPQEELHYLTIEELLNTFRQTSDQEGVVLFTNLEPRRYWFRITKGELSNEGGTFVLGEALPDNADLTTALTVGIQ